AVGREPRGVAMGTDSSLRAAALVRARIRPGRGGTERWRRDGRCHRGNVPVDRRLQRLRQLAGDECARSIRAAGQSVLWESGEGVGGRRVFSVGVVEGSLGDEQSALSAPQAIALVVRQTARSAKFRYGGIDV